MTQNALTTTTKPAGGLMTVTVSREDVADLAGHVRAKETLRVYASHRREFEAWMAQNGGDVSAPTSEQVAAYLIALDKAGIKTATLLSKRAALVYAFGDVAKAQTVQDVAGAIKRRRGAALTDASIGGVKGNTSKSKAALGDAELKTICANPPQGIKAIRDRAILLVGFWGAFRRSELVALNVEDVTFTGDGLQINVARSKTDQTGEGFTKPLAAHKDKRLDPVTALQAWLNASGVKSGAIFRRTVAGRVMDERISGQVVALVVKDAARRVGLNPKVFAGHSLRSGYVTTMRRLGISDRTTKAASGHKTDKMLDHYDKRGVREAMSELAAKFGK